MKHLTLYISLVLACLSSAAQTSEPPLRLSLDDCRQMALSHSEDLQRADNAVRQAELDKEIAFAAYLPKFDASLTGTYMYPDMDMMGMKLRMRGMYMAGINLMQPIYTGGKIRAANRLAEIGKDCAAETRRKTRMEVITEADNAYWTYIAVLWKVKLIESYKRQMDTLLVQAETSLAAGMATENDLLRIDTKQSDIDYQLNKTRNGADLCRLSLCSVIGVYPETQILPTDTVIDISAPGRLDMAIDSRPELKLLEKQVDAAEQQIKTARADILPQIGLSAGYFYYGNVKLNGINTDMQGNPQPFTYKFDDGLSLVMASVSIPIFHWGEGLKKVKKARLDLENARLDLEKNRRLLDIETRQAAKNLTDSYELIRTARLGSRQADENLRVMTDRYTNGLCSLTDLLDAQSQWQQAQSNLIEAQTQYKINETEYRRTIGSL